ncbi:PKD domain-containing protein [Desulfococcaceae bacterium HSG8]|nr:PKD domain-containing protein [Desulfococcaceae bacterium HSG8]
MVKKKCTAAAIMLFLILFSLTVLAQIPMPARIGGTLTIDGTQITRADGDTYTYVVTQQDGSQFTPVAEDTDGLNDTNWYLIDIPIYEKDEQAGGAVPGDNALIHVYKNGTELTVISPSDGELTIGESGSNSQVDIVATQGVQANQPPVANAGSDQAVTEGDMLSLDASGSSDPDPDDQIEYLWKQTAGPAVTLSDAAAVQPEFTAPDVEDESKSLTYELKVTDSSGLTDTDTVTITVSPSETPPENRPPVADAGPDQNVKEGDTVTLDASGSSDPDDNITDYLWTQISDAPVTLSDDTAVNPSFIAPDVGDESESLTYELRVTDSDGLTDTDSVVITVSPAEVPADHPPVADAGPDRTVKEGTSVTLDASGSSDQDDDIADYLWNQISGPLVTLSDDAAMRPAFTASDDMIGKSLVFELTVTDHAGLTNTDRVTINIITAENIPPVADAGPDQVVADGEAVTLDGSNSSGTIAAYLWTQISGHMMTLSDYTGVRPSFVASNGDLGGEALIFELKVADNGELTATDRVTINITSGNRPPVAYAGPDQTVKEGDTVTLDGSNSTDSDDGIASYLWTQISGSMTELFDNTAARTTFIASNGNIGGEALTYELTVTDHGGLKGTDRVTVNVTSENIPPVADAGADQNANEGDTVTLDGSGSGDTDGHILSYLWRQIGGKTVTLSDTTAVNPTFTAPETVLNSLSLTFELMVTDNGGLQHTDSVTVNITHINHPPVADAGNDQTVKEGDIVILDGSHSSDPDDGIAAYMWRQTAGTGVTLSDAAAVQPMFVAPDAEPAGGVLTFELVVTDHDGLRHSDRVTVLVTHINQAPAANAGQDQAVSEGDIVTLDGSGSSDPDDGIASYLWSQVSGTQVTLSDTGAIKPRFTAPDIGMESENLTFQLTVTDIGGLRHTDRITVTVTYLNRPPAADAGPDQTVTEGCQVTLNGSGSSDPDDGIASYLWTQVTGTSVTLSDPAAAEPSFLTPAMGPDSKSLTFELTVADHSGLTGTDRVTINITFINRTPRAHAGPVQTVKAGDTVTLDGSESEDPDGMIVSYIWTQISGTGAALSDASSPRPSFTAPDISPTGEALTFKLTVTDDGGLTDTDRVTVNIGLSDPNQMPVAAAGTDHTVREGETVTLDGSESYDPDGRISSYLWRQTGGQSVTLSDDTAERPTFTAPNADPNSESLTFRLTVTDNSGAEDTDRVTIDIAYTRQAPVADAGNSQTVDVGIKVTLDGSASHDTDGSIAAYQWRQTGGPAAELSDTASPQPVFITPPADADGVTLIFELTVTDDDGLRNTDEVRITVREAIPPPDSEGGSTSGCFIGQLSAGGGQWFHIYRNLLVNWYDIKTIVF